MRRTLNVKSVNFHSCCVEASSNCEVCKIQHIPAAMRRTATVKCIQHLTFLLGSDVPCTALVQGPGQPAAPGNASRLPAPPWECNGTSADSARSSACICGLEALFPPPGSSSGMQTLLALRACSAVYLHLSCFSGLRRTISHYVSCTMYDPPSYSL